MLLFLRRQAFALLICHADCDAFVRMKKASSLVRRSKLLNRMFAIRARTVDRPGKA